MQHTKLYIALAIALAAGCAADKELDQPTQPADKDGVIAVIEPETPGRIEPIIGVTESEENRSRGADQRADANANNSTPQHPATVKVAPTQDHTGRQQKLYAADSAVVAAEGLALPPSHANAWGRPMVHHGQYQQDREHYKHYESNQVMQVAKNPVSTFSIDVDTAAYSNVRRMLMREGRLPPQDAVKIEEFINYFDYDYPSPAKGEQPFSVSLEMAPTPWNADTQLLKVGLKGFEPQAEHRPAANLVFLIDVSGSMRSPMKLNLVKQSLRLLTNQLRPDDRVAIAVYAGAAGLVLESTPGDQKAKILNAIEGLEAGGSTNGGAGIRLAYNTAAQHLVERGINRVIIASDGDMNVGTVNHEALKDLVERNRERGIALTTLGFGAGNYNFALMEEMADVGNGNAAYIDSLKEAHKVLVKEMGSTLQTIAKDVKIQVEFNPETVAEYRLIGYENRILNREDFKNDKVDAGEIGVGHTVTALYEIALAGSEGVRVDPLRYSQQESRERRDDSHDAELGFIRLRYKAPGGDVSTEIKQPIFRALAQNNVAGTSDDFRFAAAVAGFGEILRGGKYTGQWGYPELLHLARGARGVDNDGYRGELLTLVELSRDLSGPEYARSTALQQLSSRPEG